MSVTLGSFRLFKIYEKGPFSTSHVMGGKRIAEKRAFVEFMILKS